ncbi:MAG TPA: hypothetical protein VFE30_01840 [Anaeromyxobacteraceae bacterium]|jgi:hypothetical protein|nr:hypothetical protein [Anaeromyxobacteraceae bacterium]
MEPRNQERRKREPEKRPERERSGAGSAEAREDEGWSQPESSAQKLPEPGATDE